MKTVWMTKVIIESTGYTVDSLNVAQQESYLQS